LKNALLKKDETSESIPGVYGLSGVLRVHVVEAEDLIVLNLFTNSSDPYCVLKFGNNPSDMKKAAKTEVVQKTQNPKWDQVFIVDIKNVNFMEVKVKDWDRFSGDDTCGKCLYELTDIPANVEKSIKLDLTPQGKVTLSLYFTPEGQS